MLVDYAGICYGLSARAWLSKLTYLLKYAPRKNFRTRGGVAGKDDKLCQQRC